MKFEISIKNTILIHQNSFEMKKAYLLFVMLLASFCCYGQFPLEHTYDTCSTTTNNGRLVMVNLENSGYKYIKYNKLQNKVIIYSLNHILEKEVTLPITPNLTNHESFTLFYFSEHLFNTDNLMEFILVRQGSSPGGFYCSTHIINENGVVLFYRGNEAPFVEPNVLQQQYPIYNTPAGTKLLLSNLLGQVKVYGLPGTLPTNISPDPISDEKISNLFPNPAFSDITIEYELPAKVNSGKIRIYKETGQLIKEYPIFSSVQFIRIPNNDFEPGNYFYEIITEEKLYKGKQFVILK